MISIDHPIFSHKCSQKNKKKLLNLYEQVFYIEHWLIERAYLPTRFDLGRDDSYQFFIFTFRGVAPIAERQLKERLELLMRCSLLNLIEGAHPFKCSNCENLHIIFYIKSLSDGNPFRDGKLNQYLNEAKESSSTLFN